MKIFSDFDTDGKKNEFNEAIKKYGKDNVMLIERCFAFWMMRGIFPIIIYISIAGFLGYIAFVLLSGYTIVSWGLVGIILFFGLLFINYLVGTYLEYKYDFTIVTKEGIHTYKQIGFFNSKNKDLPVSKIRSIESERFGILGNIFGYGNIVIITDGSINEKDENGRHIGGKTKVTYIKNPKKTTKCILNLCLTNR